MNWDRIRGSLKQLKGWMRIEWARVKADPRGEMAGRREMLAGKLQVAYGIGRDKAYRQLTDSRRSAHDLAVDHDDTRHRAGR